MKVAVLVDEMYHELELWYPVYRMQEIGIEVVLVGSEKGKEYKSKLGYPCKTQCCYADLKEGEYEGVVIPGGFSPDRIRRDLAAIDFVRKMNENKKMVAFICHGGWVAISAKIVENRSVTGTKAIRDDLINAGGLWKDEGIVVDQNMISAQIPKDLPEFGRAIVAFLTKG